MALLADTQTRESRTPPRTRSRRQASSCRHCGIPTSDETQEFCCAGCAYVYRLVQESGLGAYYQIKDKVTAPAEAALLPARDYQWLGEAQKTAEARAGEGTPELTLDLQGISCAGCIWLVERVFTRQAGSGRIEINAQTGQLRMSWQQGVFDAPEFARTLQGLNYLVSPASSARSVHPESRALARRIGLCAAFAMNVMLFTLPTYFGMEASFTYARLFSTLSMAFGTLSLLAGGGYFIGRAWRSLREGAMNIDVPIALGIAGSYAGSLAGWILANDTYNYFDFVSTFILLMLVGRWAQVAAVERNQRRLLAEQPAPPRVKAWIEDRETSIPPEDLVSGIRFAVGSGQTVPVEARLITAQASVGLSWINGESAPRTLRAGQRVPSGAANLGREELHLLATQGWKESLLAELTKTPSRSEFRNRLLDRVVQGYLIAIIGIAAAAGLGWWSATGDLLRSGAVVTAILVVSCPCAIGLSFPLADEMATVALRRRGVFVRINDLWHRLQKVRKLVFDKTGTLTLETPVLSGGSRLAELSDEARQVLFGLVSDNQHPVARCLHEQMLAAGEIVPLNEEVREDVGNGVSVTVRGVEWRLGRPAWASNTPGQPVQAAPCAAAVAEAGETVLSRNGCAVAAFRFQESARLDAKEELARLRRRGLTVQVLSGDQRHKVSQLAAALDLPEETAIAEMTPHGKAEWLERNGSADALMLGDGANDSLAFDQALCRGTPVVHRGVLAQKADFYYLGRGIEGIRVLFEVDDVRRRTQRALMVFSISYNLLAVGLAVAGHMNPLLAAIMMPASSLASLGIVGAGMRPIWRRVRPA